MNSEEENMSLDKWKEKYLLTGWCIYAVLCGLIAWGIHAFIPWLHWQAAGVIAFPYLIYRTTRYDKLKQKWDGEFRTTFGFPPPKNKDDWKIINGMRHWVYQELKNRALNVLRCREEEQGIFKDIETSDVTTRHGNLLRLAENCKKAEQNFRDAEALAALFWFVPKTGIKIESYAKYQPTMVSNGDKFVGLSGYLQA